MSFKDISYLALWRPLCSVEWNHLCTIGRGHYWEHSCEIILNLDQWLRRCLKKKFTDDARTRPITIAHQGELKSPFDPTPGDKGRRKGKVFASVLLYAIFPLI